MDGDVWRGRARGAAACMRWHGGGRSSRRGGGAADEVNVMLEGHFGGIAYACAVSGDYTYIGQGQDFIVLDVSSPASPVELGGVMIPCSVRDVTASGGYAYVAGGSNGLVIVDVSNKAAPSLARSYDTAGYAYGVAVSGNYAYVADGSNGLVTVDVTDKLAPTLAGRCGDTRMTRLR